MAFRLFFFVASFLARLADAGAYSSATASHILVDKESTANELKAKILAAADQVKEFAAVAKEKSSCPSKEQGGSLGNFPPGAMVPEFDKVIFDPKTKEGVVYGPTKTQFGYHLILVESRATSEL